MKEQRDILIITGTKTLNEKVDRLLHVYGFKWIDGSEMIPLKHSDAFCRELTLKEEFKVTRIVTEPIPEYYPAKIREGVVDIYHHSELTPELVATFPNAKPLKQTGPWEFEGRMWEIDGNEKRRPVPGEVYYHDTIMPFGPFKCNSQRGLFWILRPLITAELQAAMNHQRQTAKVVNEARKANREAMDKVADLRTSTP